MNKRIDLTNLGGFPFTQYSADWMQDSMRQCFMALAGLIGDMTIVTGCDAVGPQTSNGWISIDGELMPFIGGVTQANFIVEELNETRVFKDGASKVVYYKKQARFGNPGIPFANLKKPSSIKDFFTSFTTLLGNFNTFVTNTNAQITDLYSKQHIIYTGTIALGNVPTDQVVSVVHNLGLASPYFAAGVLVSQGLDYNQDNDVFHQCKDFFGNDFKLCLHKIGGAVTNLRFDYALIKF